MALTSKKSMTNSFTEWELEVSEVTSTLNDKSTLESQIMRLYSGFYTGLNSDLQFWGQFQAFFLPDIILDISIFMF